MADSLERALVPRWLERIGAVGWRLLATLGLALALAWIARELATVTASIVVALLLVLALLPLYRRARRRGAGSALAAAIASLFGAALAVLAMLLLLVAVAPHLAAIVAAVREGVADLRDAIEAAGLGDSVVSALDRIVAGVGGLLRVDPGRLVGPVISAGTVTILAAFLTYFLLSDGATGWAWAMARLQPWQAEVVTSAVRTGVSRASGYLGRTLILAAVDGLVAFTVLRLLGVDIAGPLAAVAFLGGFVPLLGSLAAGTVVILATLALAGPAAAGTVALALLLASPVAGRLLDGTPFGRQVRVGSLLVIVSILAGVALFGPLGVVALLPIVVFVGAVGRSLVVALGLGPQAGSRAATAASPAPSGVPIWLDRLGQWSWRGLVLVALVWLVVQVIVRMPYVVIPLVLASVLAATLVPLAGGLRRMGWGGGLAAFVATLGALVLIAVAIIASVAYSVGPLRDIVETAIDGADATGYELVERVVEALGAALLEDIGDFLRAVIGVIVIGVLSVLLTFFLLRDAGAIWRRALSPVAPRQRERLDGIGSEVVRILSGYMVGTAIISAFGGLTAAAIMLLLGLPLAIPIGIFTFASGFIPYIGSFLSTAISTLVAFAVGTPFDVGVMLAWTVVFNIVQGNFVTPLVYGRTMSLHPAVILLAIPAGGEIAGILGMFLIVPFVAIASATAGRLLRLIADEPEPEPEPQVAAVPVA